VSAEDCDDGGDDGGTFGTMPIFVSYALIIFLIVLSALFSGLTLGELNQKGCRSLSFALSN